MRRETIGWILMFLSWLPAYFSHTWSGGLLCGLLGANGFWLINGDFLLGKTQEGEG